MTQFINFVKTRPEAQVPTQGTAGAACWDVRAVEACVIKPGSWRAVGTGLAVEVPTGYELQVRSRSGLAAKEGVFVLNSPGCIDADYRGEVKVILANLGVETASVAAGDRIAQVCLVPVVPIRWMQATSLSTTERGEGGLGSTGKG